MESPTQHVLGLKAQVLSIIVEKTPRIASAKYKLYVRITGLFTLSFECSVSLPMVHRPWDCINRARL